MVQRQGGRGRILYLDGPGDAAGRAAVAAAVEDLEAAAALRRARLGLAGPPSDWLVASRADPGVVRRVWGPEVVAVGIERFRLPAGPPPWKGRPAAGWSLPSGPWCGKSAWTRSRCAAST